MYTTVASSTSSGSRNFGEGGPRNMKYKPPHSAAIFFCPIFTGRGGGGMAPLAPPLDPLLSTQYINELLSCLFLSLFHSSLIKDTKLISFTGSVDNRRPVHDQHQHARPLLWAQYQPGSLPRWDRCLQWRFLRQLSYISRLFAACSVQLY